MTDKKIALVTGASRGIGFQIACKLARADYHILATARTVGGLEALEDEIVRLGSTATLIPLDLRETEQVDAMGPALFERYGKLDCFIANAAILGPLSPIGHIREKDWQQVQNINLNANWRLVRTLDPLLKNSKDARVLFVTDRQGANRAYWSAYNISKQGLETLAHAYAEENKSTNISVYLGDPGPTNTKLYVDAFPGLKNQDIKAPEIAADFLVQKMQGEIVNELNAFDYVK